MRALITAVLMSLSVSLSATTFYVSNTGNDGSDGKTEATAWKTISKVNAQTFSPGDIISFKCGGTWRETLVVPNSGSASSNIVFNSYGSGDKPKILGSTQATGWENQGGNIWKSSTMLSVNPFITASFESDIFFYGSGGEITWGRHVASLSSLASEYQWTWVSNYVYVYSATDPDSRYASVEVPQRNYGIKVGNTNQYITIDGFDIRHAKNINVYDDDPETSLTGFTIRNCNLSYVGSRDQADGYNLSVCRNNLVIQNNEIFEGGRRQISIHVYDASNLTFSNITIEGNTCHDGYHGSGFGIAMDGSRTGNRFENIIVRNNLFYDRESRDPDSDGWDPSSLGAVRAEETGASIANVQIYNNIFKYPNTYALSLTNVDNVTVYNNTFYEFNHNTTTTGSYHILIGANNTQMKIKNNIFYGTQAYSVTGKTMSIVIEAGQSFSEIEMDYNLFYEADTYMTIVQTTSTNYRSTNWSSLKSTYGWQAHEPGLLNPKFVNAPSDLHLSATSPAIGAGLDVNINSDFEYFKFPDPPSIGALEYNSGIQIPSVPEFISAVVENATPSRVDMTYSQSLANLVPATSAFTVMVNSAVRSVNSVVVSGTKVQLTLASPVVYGDVVKVSYTVPSTNPLQNADAEKAAAITAKPVTNNVAAISPVFVSAAVENITPSRLTMTYSLSLANVAPATTSFKVMVNSTARTVSSVSVSGTTVQLILASPVVYGDVLTVSYTKPSASPLQTTTGGQAATISSKPVTNNVNPANPVFVSAVVENASSNRIDITYSLTLTDIIPDASAFTVLKNAVPVNITSVAVTGTKVLLTIATPIVYGDAVKVSYTEPFANPLQTSLGATAASLSLQNVTNKVLSATDNKSTSADMSVYPNPARNYFTIAIQDEFTTALILRVCDMSGRVHLTVQLDPGTKNYTQAIHLKSGTYLIQVVTAGQTVYSQKLMVKR